MSLDLAANHTNIPNAANSKIIVKLSDRGMKVIGVDIATTFFTLDSFLVTP
jgi:allantoicase